MRKFLRLSLVALCAMVCNVAFADAYKTLTFPDGNEKSVSSYTDTWNATINGDTWVIENFNNNKNAWAFIRCGREKVASTASIATDFAIDQAVSSVIVTFDNINNADKINSISLVVASDASFSNVIETIDAPNKESGDMIFEIANPTANSYYKLVIDCQATGKNGTVQISKLQYMTGTVKKSADLKFSETNIEVEQGAAFTSPTFTKSTTAPVTFSSDNEFVASVNTEGTISLGGETGTAKITARSEENDEYLAGEATCTINVVTYNTYKKVTTITSGKEYLIVVQNNNRTYYASPVSSNDDYDYLSVFSVSGLTETLKINTKYDDDFVFTATDGGFTIMQPDGRYLYMSEDHNSFQVGEEPASGNIWTVEPNDDGTFTITNKEKEKYVQYDDEYNSFGSYEDNRGIMPFLYEKDETSSGIRNVTVDELDENAPVYNLAGQRVSKDAKGIVIQNGKKYIRK